MDEDARKSWFVNAEHPFIVSQMSETAIANPILSSRSWFLVLSINILPFVDMFADGKLDIFAIQNRYNSVSQNFDMLPNGNKFDINPLSPRKAYHAPQRNSWRSQFMIACNQIMQLAKLQFIV